jgi:cytoskeletal protein CcmA (bactofilin family)
VDGEVDGEIVSRGTLWLGENARVTGSIEVGELIVAGTVEGVATARDRILLAPTARVRGTVRAPRVAMGEGCVLEGRCETTAPVESSG